MEQQAPISEELRAEIEEVIATQYGDMVVCDTIEEHQAGANNGYGYIVSVETPYGYIVGDYCENAGMLVDETPAASGIEAGEMVKQRHQEVPFWKQWIK